MQYDFNLAANASQNIDVRGRFFKYKSGTGSIRVRTSAGGYVDLLPGQGVWNVDFTTLTVSDRTSSQNVGVILAGEFDFHDDRIVGTVDVVDGGKVRVQSGVTFAGSKKTAPGGGALYAVTQLWNPVGSGKNVYVAQVNVDTDVAGVLLCSTVNAELNPGVSVAIQNKRTGGADSTAVMESLAHATLGGPGTLRKVFEMPMGGNVPFNYKFTEPFMLTPGYGINVYHGTVATGDVFASFEIIEELVV
jgi:hypothetical protein